MHPLFRKKTTTKKHAIPHTFHSRVIKSPTILWSEQVLWMWMTGWSLCWPTVQSTENLVKSANSKG